MRRKYVRYYEPAGRGADGRETYRYTGPHYAFALSGRPLRRFKIAQILLSALVLALFVAAGCIGNDGTRAMYIALPYAATLLPAALSLASAAALWKLPARFTLPEERHAVGRLRACAAAQMALSVMASVGEIAFIARIGAGPGEFLFLALLMLSALASSAMLLLLAHNPAMSDGGPIS